MGLHQTKNFCTAKETTNKIKDNPWNGRVVFADTGDKGLISKMYKEFTKLITKNQKNNAFKKWAKDMNRYFSRGCTDGQQDI